MPAQIVLVHDAEPFRTITARALRDAGYSVAEYQDALAATDAMKRASTIELLITRLNFAPGRSNGAALARMMKMRKPEACVIFVTDAGTYEEVEDIGAFLAPPVTVARLLGAVRQKIGRPPGAEDG